MDQPTRRSVLRRRRHRPPAIVGDPIEYPPAPYSAEARFGTVGFLGRSLRDRGFPRRYRWAAWLVGVCVALPFVVAAIAALI